MGKQVGHCGSNCEGCKNKPDAQWPTCDSHVVLVNSPLNIPRRVESGRREAKGEKKLGTG